MPRVNLLPWREELRKERQRIFFIAAGSAVVLGIGVVFGTHMTYNDMIEHQKDRNDLLKDEIAYLDKQIEEIQDLEAQKERLLARMEIIEQLQRSRPEPVHLFDELARTLPEGVTLQEVRQRGKRITIKGLAQSSTRVSAYMRNIDASDWLTDPGLNVVETVETRDSRASEFTVFANQVSPTKSEEGDGS